MRRFTPLALAAAAALLLAACTGPSAGMPDVTVSSISPSQLTVDTASFTIEGANFFEYVDGEGTRVEFCGVSVVAELIDPSSRTINLAPAGRVSIEAGERVVVEVPAEGLQPGVSDLRIVRPDGSATVIADGITCVAAPTEELQENRAPTARIEVANHDYDLETRVLSYRSASTDPDGDELTYAWEAWSLPIIGQEEPVLEPVAGVVNGAEFVVTRPAMDFHFLELTVTDPAGLSDSVMFLTILDPLGDLRLPIAPQAMELPEPPAIDFVRASWTLDAERGTTLFELEAEADFKLPAYDPGYCMPAPTSDAGALLPQQDDEVPTLGGGLLFLTGFNFADPQSSEIDSLFALSLDHSNADGSFNLFSAETGDVCDPTAAVSSVSVSAGDGMLRFGLPSSFVGLDSMMIGLIGAVGGGVDTIPELGLPQ